VVLRMTSLSGWRTTPLDEVAAVAKAGSSRRVANTTENRACMRPPGRCRRTRRRATSTPERDDGTRYIGQPGGTVHWRAGGARGQLAPGPPGTMGPLTTDM